MADEDAKVPKAPKAPKSVVRHWEVARGVLCLGDGAYLHAGDCVPDDVAETEIAAGHGAVLIHKPGVREPSPPRDTPLR